MLVPSTDGDSHESRRTTEPASAHLTLHFMSLRIVVVDDNTDLVESLVSVLALLGHDAAGANGGAEGVRLIEERKPDVAFVDVGMPGVSGFDVASQVRRHSWGHSILLIALTGWGRSEDREQCHDAGFDHVAIKPVDIDYLRILLERVESCTPLSVPAVQAARTDAPLRAARP